MMTLEGGCVQRGFEGVLRGSKTRDWEESERRCGPQAEQGRSGRGRRGGGACDGEPEEHRRPVQVRKLSPQLAGRPARALTQGRVTEAGSQRLDHRGWITEAGSQRLDHRGWVTEAGSQRLGHRGWITEAGSLWRRQRWRRQRSGARGGGAEVLERRLVAICVGSLSASSLRLERTAAQSAVPHAASATLHQRR